MGKKAVRVEETKGAAEAAPSFEARLAELEEIVRQLEAGERPLEESLALYERGVAALKSCHALLDKAELRIRRLVRDAGGKPMLEDADRGAIAGTGAGAGAGAGEDADASGGRAEAGKERGKEGGPLFGQ